MKKFLIIGVGEFGSHVARYLKDLKNEVFVVDIDSDKIEALKDEFSSIVRADCLQELTLKELDVPHFDACIVAVGDNFQASLEITSRLKELRAKYIVSRSYSEIQSKFLLMAGANEIVYPEKYSAEKVANTLTNTRLLDVVRVSNDLCMCQVSVPKSWVKKTLVELNIRRELGLNVLAVERKGQTQMADPYFAFEEGDSIFVFGPEENAKKLLKKK